MRQVWHRSHGSYAGSPHGRCRSHAADFGIWRRQGPGRTGRRQGSVPNTGKCAQFGGAARPGIGFGLRARGRGLRARGRGLRQGFWARRGAACQCAAAAVVAVAAANARRLALARLGRTGLHNRRGSAPRPLPPMAAASTVAARRLRRLESPFYGRASAAAEAGRPGEPTNAVRESGPPRVLRRPHGARAASRQGRGLAAVHGRKRPPPEGSGRGVAGGRGWRPGVRRRAGRL